MLGQGFVMAASLLLAVLLPGVLYERNGLMRDLLSGVCILVGALSAVPFSVLIANNIPRKGLVLLVLAMVIFLIPMLLATALVIFDGVFIGVVYLPLCALLGFGLPATLAWITRRSEWSDRLVGALVFQEVVIGLYLLAASLAYWTLVN